jgi:uroporphyrinogen decarboxylase
MVVKEGSKMSKRRNRMTDRQRVETLLNHQKPDRIPIWPFDPIGFAAIYNRISLADAYTNPEACYAAQRKTSQDFGWVFYPTLGYASLGAWEFGGEVKLPIGEFEQAPSIIRFPVEKEEDVYHLKWPGPTDGIFPVAGKFALIAREERLDNEPFNASIAAGGSFTLATNIASVERFLKWLIKKPKLAHDLLRFVTDWRIAQLSKRREILNLDGVLPGGGEVTTSNQLISVDHFKEFALPYLKEINNAVLSMGYKHIFYHICGDQNKNLPYWAEVDFGNPGILSFGHEVELETAARFFPNHIMMGNLEPAIIQTQTPEKVYEATRKVVEQGKKIAGGYIFSTGCQLPPRSPIENVKMMVKAVNDFGWYE